MNVQHLQGGSGQLPAYRDIKLFKTTSAYYLTYQIPERSTSERKKESIIVRRKSF